jgi:hypothetical protein
MKAFCVVALLLSACSTLPQQTVIGSVKPIEVSKVVKEPCIAAEQIPSLPANAMPSRGADIEALGNGLAANSERLLGIVQTQRKLLQACAQLQPKEPSK